jgi:NADPH:quinone reductase
MFACVISAPGGPEVLEIRDVPTPVPGAGELLVRVRTSALNRVDIRQRMGKYPAPPGAPRDIPGLEFAGEVVVLGPGATRWRVGDRVFGIVAGGAHAEYLVVHEEAIAGIPGEMTWQDAGAIPEAFITAHDAAITQAGLGAGERMLIHAIGSGVGLAAVQVARVWGAVPFGTSRTADKLERARAFGMEDGVVTRELDSLGPAVAAWTAGRGMEVILDLVGGPYVAAGVEVAALKGRIMLIGTVAGGQATLELGRVLHRRLTIRGTVLRPRSLEERITATRAFDLEVVPRLRDGTMRPTIDSVFPLSQIADAHRRMESNETFGKVVIEM